jgi:hypothetical protein
MESTAVHNFVYTAFLYISLVYILKIAQSILELLWYAPRLLPQEGRTNQCVKLMGVFQGAVFSVMLEPLASSHDDVLLPV